MCNRGGTTHSTQYSIMLYLTPGLLLHYFSSLASLYLTSLHDFRELNSIWSLIRPVYSLISTWRWKGEGNGVILPGSDKDFNYIFNLSFSFESSTTDLHIQGIEWYFVSWHYFNYIYIFFYVSWWNCVYSSCPGFPTGYLPKGQCNVRPKTGAVSDTVVFFVPSVAESLCHCAITQRRAAC